MQKIVYKAKYFCDLCANYVTTNIYGDTDHNFSKDEESEAIEWAKHFHWIEKHRLCAICGMLVEANTLELAFNDGSISIHENYTDEYERVKRKDSKHSLLIVHSRCLEK